MRLKITVDNEEQLNAGLNRLASFTPEDWRKATPDFGLVCAFAFQRWRHKKTGRFVSWRYAAEHKDDVCAYADKYGRRWPPLAEKYEQWRSGALMPGRKPIKISRPLKRELINHVRATVRKAADDAGFTVTPRKRRNQ